MAKQTTTVGRFNSRSDGILDALAAVQWAETHIPLLQERFMSWQRSGPYEMVMEPDSNDAEWEFLVAYLRKPLDRLVVADVGAIISSIRTALDILVSALLTGNGIKPNSNAHFPIRKTSADFLSAASALETKKWLTPLEAATIKDTKAYCGGSHVLYPLHQLDILRKHERLLIVEPKLENTEIMVLDGSRYAHHRAMDDKTILYRMPSGQFRPTKGNTLLTTEIFFNEPTLLKTKQPAVGVLRTFVANVRAVIQRFD